MGFLVDGNSPLRRHWRTILRLMVRPELQGRGAGRLLLEGLHGTAAELGLEQLMLTTRGGTGVERFTSTSATRSSAATPVPSGSRPATTATS